MSLTVDHIHNLDRRITNKGDGLSSVGSANLGAGGVPMALWVPSERIGFHGVSAPNAPERKWSQLMPWLLEDRILQPVEDMHFVIWGRGAVNLSRGALSSSRGALSSSSSVENQLQVLAVSREDMQHWCRVAQNAGVTAISMVPDFLALPWEAGRINVGWREGTCLVRCGADEGFAASPDIAWARIEGLIQQAEIAPRLSISIPDRSMVPEQLRQLADINDGSIDWSFADIPATPNLLQGDFKPNSAKLRETRWQSVAGLGVLALALLFAYLQISNNLLSNQVQQLEKQLVSGHSKLFGTGNIQAADVRDSAERQLSFLFKQQQGLRAGPVAGLVALDSLMAGCDCELVALQEDSGTLSLSLDGGAKLKTQALNVEGYQTSITQGANSSSGGDGIILTLKPASELSADQSIGRRP